MTTNLQSPCAVSLGMEEAAVINVGGHQVNAHEFMAIKRMNSMLSQELGLLCRVSSLEHHEALLLTVQIVVTRLLTRLPRERVSNALREAYTSHRDYGAYYKQSIHPHLGRGELDRSFPIGLTMIATPQQFILTNIILKVLNKDEDNSDDGLWLLLQEALTAWLMMTMIRPVEEVEALCGLCPETEAKADNVIQFGQVSVDKSYDQFSR